MSLGRVILLMFGSLLLVGVAAATYEIEEELKPRYREGIENSLIDTAQILASIWSKNGGSGQSFKEAMDSTLNRPIEASIYNSVKTKVDLRVIVTDKRGIVTYSSHNQNLIGADFSKWRDIHLTLKGEYGARTTRDNLQDPSSTVLYVGAPIRINGAIEGVLEVGKPQSEINQFIAQAKLRFIIQIIIGALFLMVLGYVLVKVISSATDKLINYSQKVTDGKNPAVPKLGIKEFNSVAQSLEKMKNSLEGKKYIEEYIQHLTHELKSPTTAIKAAGELLRENIEPKDRAKFIENIIKESERLEEILEKLLELTGLEHLSEIEKGKIAISSIINASVEGVSSLALRKGVQIKAPASCEGEIKGDRFLLEKALINILKNAIEFSSPSQVVLIEAVREELQWEIIVTDEGAGIPEYATKRLGEKFFSLPRPDTNRKGTGLGVALAKRVAELHGGRVTFYPNTPKGTKVVFRVSNKFD